MHKTPSPQRPFMRKIIHRLPDAVKPKPERHGYVLGLDTAGNVVQNLQDPSGICAQTNGAIEFNGDLFVGSLSEDFVARVPL